MASINPNTLTNTRIPNTVYPHGPVGSLTYNFRDLYSLTRCLSDDTFDYLSIGIRKRKFQYDKGKFYSGLTPGDNGYLNDGGVWSTSADGTSRFYLGSPFEWWSGYVIYCYDPNDTNPDSGYDGVETYVANDVESLISITKKLTGITSSTDTYIMKNEPGHQGSAGTAGGAFNGVYYLRTGYVSNFNLISSYDYYFNISFNAVNFNNPMTLFSKRTDGGQCDFELTIQNDTTILYTIDNQVLTYNVANISTNTWYDIELKTFVINFDPIFYKPILNIKTSTYGSSPTIYHTSDPVTNTAVSSSIDVTIGCSSWNNPSKLFNGYLDEFEFRTSGGVVYSYLDFNNFSVNQKYFTDSNSKVFTIYPDPTNITNKLTEYVCLESLTKHDFLCINTHYPDITPRPNSVPTGQPDEFIKNLKLLIDFGFIPCYPRGGSMSYDISGNKKHTMVLNGTYSYVEASISNSGGGALEILSNSYGRISYSSDLNRPTTTINTWVKLNKVSSGDQVILSSYSLSNHTGYAIIESGSQFGLVYGDGITENFLYMTGTVSVDTWYNVMCTFTVGGDANIYVSDNTTFILNGPNGDSVTPTSPIIVNTSSAFQIGGFTSGIFDGQISLVSVYDIIMSTQLYDLWNAYTGTYPNRYNPGYDHYVAYDYVAVGYTP